MKRNFSLIALFLLTLHALSQSDFRSGFIISNEFDTIPGLLSNNNYYENSRYVDYKSVDLISEVRRYYPHELFGYRFVDGKFYISKEINGEKVFLEYLINGNLDIYFIQDELGKNHYYVSKDSLPLRELEYGDEVKIIDGKEYVQEVTRYKAILNYYTYDCPEIKGNIKTLGDPKHDNLIKLAKNYHEKTCNGQECIIYEKGKKLNIKLLSELGTTRISGNNNEDETYYPSAGVQILLQQLSFSERLYTGLGFYYDAETIRIPLSFSYINSKKGSSPYFGYDFDINYFFMRQAIRAGLKYNFGKASILLIGDIKTEVFTHYYASSLRLAVEFDLR